MRLIARHGAVRASLVLLLIPLLAAIDGCGDATDSGTRDGGTDAGSGGAPRPRALVAVLDDRTAYEPTGQNRNDLLKVLDPATPASPLLELSGLNSVGFGIGVTRMVAASMSKRRLGVVETSRLRLFDEDLKPLVNVKVDSLNEDSGAVCPTEQAIFAITSKGFLGTGKIVKFDLNGAYVGSTRGPHGIDLVVDEDRQVIWTVGLRLTRVTTDLAYEEQLHAFEWAAVSLDLDGDGGIWAAERHHPDISGSVDQILHFDADGNMISADTLKLDGSPLLVRVDRNSGLVWVMMRDKGIAYRDLSGQLKTVPGLSGHWYSVEPDPLDGSRVWAANATGHVVHVDTKGTLIQTLESFSTSHKWLAVMLKGP